MITNINTIYSHYSIYYRLESIDPENDAVTYELLDGPEGAEVRHNNVLYWSHSLEDINAAPGFYPMTVKVTDEHGLWSTAVFPVWVTEERIDQGDIDSGEVIPPEVVSQDQELVFIVGQTTTYALPMPDMADGYSYERVSGPLGLAVENNTITWKPFFIGNYNVTVRLTNGTLSYEYSFNISVRTNENNPPVLHTSGFPSVFYINEPFEYQFEMSDPDGDPVSFDVTHLPPTARMNDQGLFEWTPTTYEIGDQTLEIVLDDSVGYISTNTLEFEVREFRNRAPRFTQMSPPHFAVVGAAYEYQFLATDPDGDDLTFTVENAPQGMVVDNTGLVTIDEVAFISTGEYEVAVIAHDSEGGTATVTYSLAVDDNTAPAITTVPKQAAHIGDSYWYGPRATDREGHDFSFALVSGPDNAEMSESSGEINWTPSEGQEGSNQFQVSVTDQFGGTNVQTFEVYVYADQIMYRNVCPAPTSYQ